MLAIASYMKFRLCATNISKVSMQMTILCRLVSIFCVSGFGFEKEEEPLLPIRYRISHQRNRRRRCSQLCTGAARVTTAIDSTIERRR